MTKKPLVDPLRYRHVKRLVLVTAVGFLVLLTGKTLLVPKTYGDRGPYRAAAIDEIRARTPAHIGKAACIECHDDLWTKAVKGKHSVLSCESCHGPMALHAEDQTDENSKTPFAEKDCLTCHRKLAARPKFMPQINPAVHYSKDGCYACHSPHTPRAHARTPYKPGARKEEE